MRVKAVKRIAELSRLSLSKSGNPRFRVAFTDGSFTSTKPDAAVNYGIENPEYKDRDLVVTYEDGLIIYLDQVDAD